VVSQPQWHTMINRLEFDGSSEQFADYNGSGESAQLSYRHQTVKEANNESQKADK
jgi:hypothetical protein